jgi:hypothetical protein
MTLYLPMRPVRTSIQQSIAEAPLVTSDGSMMRRLRM